MYNHGEIWLANLNPGRGTEPGKVRPVLLLQNQALLDVEHPSTIVIPLTTNLVDDAEPLRLRITAQGKLASPAMLTVFLNGVVVQPAKEAQGPTGHKTVSNYDTAHPPEQGLRLQDHGDPVRFRNIWIRRLRPSV